MQVKKGVWQNFCNEKVTNNTQLHIIMSVIYKYSCLLYRLPLMRRPSSISGEGGDSDKEESCTQLTDIMPVKPPFSFPALFTHLEEKLQSATEQRFEVITWGRSQTLWVELWSACRHVEHMATLVRSYIQLQVGGRHWLSLTHSMRHFTSDSILLRHHNRHNFSQSSLPITISSSNPQSSHPELYVRNSTSLPNSTPLSRLRQLLATQPPGTHPSSFGMCTARNYFTNTLSLRF